jgi:hypothetical protein
MKRLIILSLMLMALPLAAAEAPKPAAPGARFEGMVADTQGQVSGKTATFLTVQADSWTSDSEILEYARILKEKGQDELLKVLWKAKTVGWIRIGSDLGHQVSIIRSIADKDGGRIIRVLTDRTIQFSEAMRDTRSSDYPFGIIELKIDKEGNGEGVLIAAASIAFDEQNVLQVKNYGTKPFKVFKVRTEVAKP